MSFKPLPSSGCVLFGDDSYARTGFRLRAFCVLKISLDPHKKVCYNRVLGARVRDAFPDTLFWYEANPADCLSYLKNGVDRLSAVFNKAACRKRRIHPPICAIR